MRITLNGASYSCCFFDAAQEMEDPVHHILPSFSPALAGSRQHCWSHHRLGKGGSSMRAARTFSAALCSCVMPCPCTKPCASCHLHSCIQPELQQAHVHASKSMRITTLGMHTCAVFQAQQAHSRPFHGQKINQATNSTDSQPIGWVCFSRMRGQHMPLLIKPIPETAVK